MREELSKKLKSRLNLMFELERRVFKEKENITQTSSFIINNSDNEYPLSYDILVNQMIYNLFTLKINNPDEYLNFIIEILRNKSKSYFIKILLNDQTQEAYYLLEKMIENNLLEPKVINENPYFVHYMKENEIENMLRNNNEFINEIKENYDNLSKNDWELHKQLIKEGHNPNEIAKIIRNDEIEKLQEISSQTNFNFNQTIKPSLYERCSFVNQNNVSLIDYAAFFSSVKCFKYLLLNGAKVTNAGKYAVAGGNEEIIHLCEQNHSSFNGAYEAAIKFHQDDIFKYIYENKIEKINNYAELGWKCILVQNYTIFSFLFQREKIVNISLINESARKGNLFLTLWLLTIYIPPKIS